MSGEVGESMHDVPVMLDVEGRLAHEILCKALDGGYCRLKMAPDPSFSISNDSTVCFDFGEHVPSNMKGSHGFDRMLF
jgi:hypothetical protein